MKVQTAQGGSTDVQDAIDVLEWQLPIEVLRVLLKDRTTGQNIVWATKDYEHQFGTGKGFGEKDEIKAECLADREHPVIRPRTVKATTEQRQRSVEKGEVFTPSWVCNQQNNLVDAAWFVTKRSPFNVETVDRKTGQRGWKRTLKPIARFPKGKTWLDYVFARRLEIACGEAPYLTSRYDAVTGVWIPVEERIGLLDRKLRLVGENFTQWGPDRWFEAAKWSVQSVYGYDWQGDNVLLARENILFTVMEHFNSDFHSTGLFSEKSMLELAEIISWNIWQMDGIRFVRPNSCGAKPDPSEFGGELAQLKPCLGCKKNDIWLHNGDRCKVMDWTTGQVEEFLPHKPKKLSVKETRRWK